MNNPSEVEILDLVDENDVVIGQIDRNEAYNKGFNNIRVVNVFIKNDEGKLFIPRRQSNKRLYPSALDMSAAGHVSSGETYEEAFRKEVQEELNINIDDVSWRTLGKLSPAKDDVHNFMTVYEIISNTTPDYNKQDFSEHYWLTLNEITERIDAGDSAKSDLPILIKKFHL